MRVLLTVKELQDLGTDGGAILEASSTLDEVGKQGRDICSTFIRNRSSGKGCEAPAKDAAAEERPDTTLRLEESEEVPTCILGSVLGLEMIIQKGQDEVLAKEAVEFCVLIVAGLY